MASNLLNTLSEKIPGALGSRAVYGEQVDLAGNPIIPVTYTAFGFGSGEGTGRDETGSTGEATGGGGGGVSIPIGAYVSRDGKVEFEPNLITLVVVSVPLVYAVGKALASVIRAFR